MRIEITWMDAEDIILDTKTFDPHADEWSEFKAMSLHDIITMGGEECTHMSMQLLSDQ